MLGLLALAFGVWPQVASASADLSSEAVPNQASTAKVTILLVGENPASDALTALIRELLGGEGIECEFSRAREFEVDDLFASAERDAGVRVFIRMLDEHRARLYFRGPFGQRFLLRTLSLRNGLDEVGQELMGQVVESSVVALLHSLAGLSREQVAAEVADEVSVPAAALDANRTASKGASTLDSSSPKPMHTADKNFDLGLNFRYTVRYDGSDFDLAHGPGAELSFALHKGLFWRGRLTGDHFLPQSLRIQELSAKLDTNSVRLSVDLGLKVARNQVVMVALGAGLNWVHLEPGTPRVADLAPAPPRADLIPFIRPEFRYEISSSSWVLALSAFADVSLSNTHYDLIVGDVPHELATPLRIRPGAALAFGVHIPR